MKLTAAQIRAAEPRDRAYKIADGQGLFLYVAPTGLKSFRMGFRFAGKEQLLVFGRFPDMTLAQARDRRDQARVQIAANINPAGARKRAHIAIAAAAGALTFERAARSWATRQKPTWSAEHYKDVIFSLERHVFPAIGAKGLADIDKHQVLELIRAIEASGAIETARRVRTRISAVFEASLADNNPAAAIGKAMAPKIDAAHMSAELTIAGARGALSAVLAAATRPIDALAAELLALTAVRPGVIPIAEWSEFEGIGWDDGSAIDPIWRIPAAHMKLAMKRKADQAFEHVVTLAPAAVGALRRLRAIAVDDRLAFARGRGAPIGKNALGSLHLAAGLAGRHSPHGWRASFSTIMNALEQFTGADIDAALAHQTKGKVEAAYNRSVQLRARRAIFEKWADLLVGKGDEAAAVPASA